tara:strand:- start:2159 stop:2443 length:285 start_codon:yes stop_codon:yes gene_type:complete
MKSYLQIIKEKSEGLEVPLITAFKTADIPTSTYYRTIHEVTELRFETAEKVMKAIGKLYALQQARKDTAELRVNGERPHRSSARAAFKSRSSSI